jgi:ABC-type polysaccharide/polyol phosphate transport system ATPase subunit/SAM-dependent methyltransferase
LNQERSAAIRVAGLSKSFRLPHESRTTVREYVLHPFRRTVWETQTALLDVSFDVERGEFFGVIGRNGSGKSTLLKILAGIYRPDAGSVELGGKLSPFIELGVGFNPELNARDNIRLNGTLLGLTPEELSARFDEIVAFAELERFVDQKLKNYSSGMQLRLAYSIAIQVPFDILLLDEVLAVGDQNFQEKCFATFDTMQATGKTVVLVTHSMAQVTQFCNRCLLLRDGVVQAVAAPQEVIDMYLDQEKSRPTAFDVRLSGPVQPIRGAGPTRKRSAREEPPSQEQQAAVAFEDAWRLVAAELQGGGAVKQVMRALGEQMRERGREVDQLTRMVEILSRRHYDNVPLPPEPLRRRMSTRASSVNYLAQGLAAADKAVAVFGESPGEPVLEWGCGSGRTLRWLTCYPGWRKAYRGCDSDAEAVAWTATNIGSEIQLCTEDPPLPYDDSSLGGLFALGTLTAIHPTRHRAWYAELHRVLRAGSPALLGTQGPSLAPDGADATGETPVQSLQARGWAYIENPGSRAAAFVTERFTRACAEGLFEVAEYRPRGHGLTDTYLLRRVGRG